MNKKSRRHHYVPQFHTKYFSKEDGKIYVYDKINESIYENNAINLFVEKDRNTFPNFDGIDDDQIEKSYTYFDTLFSSVLKEMTATGVTSNENFKLLLLFAYISNWRVRQYDESFAEAKDHFSVDDLGLGLRSVESLEKLDINLENHFTLDVQQELKRFLLAAQPFRFKEDFKLLLDQSFLISTPWSSFLGDCPFNEATIISNNVFEDFVFPVTKELTLVYSTRINRAELIRFLSDGSEIDTGAFLKDFSIARDISTLALAERNVSCCDLDYLTNLVDHFKSATAKGTNTAFNLTVFNVLYRYQEYIK